MLSFAHSLTAGLGNPPELHKSRKLSEADPRQCYRAGGFGGALIMCQLLTSAPSGRARDPVRRVQL